MAVKEPEKPYVLRGLHNQHVDDGARKQMAMTAHASSDEVAVTSHFPFRVIGRLKKALLARLRV